jgi:hypothetical protein
VTYGTDKHVLYAVAQRSPSQLATVARVDDCVLFGTLLMPLAARSNDDERSVRKKLNLRECERHMLDGSDDGGCAGLRACGQRSGRFDPWPASREGREPVLNIMLAKVFLASPL